MRDKSASEIIRDLETRIARLEGNKTASTPVRKAAQEVLEAMAKMERELEKMPSFTHGQDRFYQDLAERWDRLHMEVKEEVKYIAGAY